MFYDNYASLCKKKGISPSKAAEEIGINKASVTNWKKNGYTPRASILQRIATYFDIPVSRLLAADVTVFEQPEQEKKPTPTDRDGLSEEQLEIIRRYDAAPPALRAAALAVLKSAEEQCKLQGGDKEER